ncbi:MAG: NblA/ycf18 family protein [Chroococcidiopsidaceae cyanobacterium CP_BM_RX_35]|nr:NblA/ycf18 family protein [Chroococcidiopsidaceae cyanobacterium CP_BM_RX_35]
MNSQDQLSLEQEFTLTALEQQLKELSQAETQALLLELYRNAMIRENTYRELLRDAWNIGKDFKETLGISSEPMSF